MYILFAQLIQQADEVRELFRTLIRLHTKRGNVKVGRNAASNATLKAGVMPHTQWLCVRHCLCSSSHPTPTV